GALGLSTQALGALNGDGHCVRAPDRRRVATILARTEMRTAKHSKLFPHRRDGGAGHTADAKIPARELASVAALLANAFGKLNLDRRARLLGRLLGSFGLLA